MKILREALNKIKSNKKQRLFFEILIGGLIGIMGKKNFRNLSRYTEFTEHTFGRQMTKQFDFVGLNAALIEERLKETKMAVLIHDSSFIPKSGKKTNGLGFYWNGSESKAEKGLELDVISASEVGDNRSAFTISAEQILSNPLSKPVKKRTKKGAKKKSKPIKENSEENTHSKIDAAVEHVKKIIKVAESLNINHVVGDAFYTKIKYVDGVLALGLNMIGKLRKDARLRKPYKGPQKSRGRKKQFDIENVSDKDFEKSPAIKLDKKGIKLQFCIGYSESLKREIKIVRISKTTENQEVIALLFSTDLNLDAMQIYSCYTTRFQIEFVFRDAKNFTGLNDCQSRDEKRLHYHFNASLTALNVVKMQDYELSKNNIKPQPFSMASWTRKYTLEIILNRILPKLGLNLTLVKSDPNFKDVLSLGKINFGN